jgi:hypothetical protein
MFVIDWAHLTGIFHNEIIPVASVGVTAEKAAVATSRGSYVHPA